MSCRPLTAVANKTWGDFVSLNSAAVLVLDRCRRAVTLAGLAACGTTPGARSQPGSRGRPSRAELARRGARQRPGHRPVDPAAGPRSTSAAARADLGLRRPRARPADPRPRRRPAPGRRRQPAAGRRPRCTGTASRCATTWTACPASPRTRSPPAAAFSYEFTVPDPGTYFYHPHVGRPARPRPVRRR